MTSLSRAVNLGENRMVPIIYIVRVYSKYNISCILRIVQCIYNTRVVFTGICTNQRSSISIHTINLYAHDIFELHAKF